MDKASKELDQYLADARSWETSAVLEAKKAVAFYAKVAVGGVVIGVIGFSVGAIQYSAPPPPPLAFIVDKSTGVVEQATSLTVGKITPQEATDKYFAQLYVQYRESWDPDLARTKDQAKELEKRAQGYYYRAGLMSTPDEQRRLEAFYRSDKSPWKVYGENARAYPVIKGSSYLAPNVLAVRFTLMVERNGIAVPEQSDRTATVSFRYSNGVMSARDRAINPLGFQANYHTDQDVPDSVPVKAATPAVDRPQPTVPAAPIGVVPAAPQAASLDLRTLQERGR